MPGKIPDLPAIDNADVVAGLLFETVDPNDTTDDPTGTSKKVDLGQMLADSTGDNGWSPILAVVTDGTRRVFQISDWTGGEGTKPGTGDYIGATGLVADIANAVDIRGAQGLQGNTGATGSTGTAGADGDDGWSPVYAVASDGARRVLQITDWTGGDGTKPDTGYVGASGIVPDIEDGVDIRGSQGANGTNGTNGIDGRQIELGQDGTYLLWRYVGDTDWNVLTTLAAITGPAGPEGPAGATGATGPGVPAGGSTGQWVRKASNDDYDLEFADAPSGGGGRVLLATYNLSSDAFLVAPDLTGYQNFQVEFDDVTCDANGYVLCMQSSADNGSTWLTETDTYYSGQSHGGTYLETRGKKTRAEISYTTRNLDGRGLTGTLSMFMAGQSGLPTVWIWDVTEWDYNADEQRRIMGYGSTMNAVLTNALRFFFSGSNLLRAGTVRVYGLT